MLRAASDDSAASWIEDTIGPFGDGVVGRDASFEVPACGHVVQGQFVLNRYDIVDSQGRFVARHGGGGSNPASVTPAYEMVTSAGAVYSDLHPPAEPLPDCRGAVQGQ